MEGNMEDLEQQQSFRFAIRDLLAQRLCLSKKLRMYDILEFDIATVAI